MIPKIIHYVWLGNKPKPKILKKCIKSWAKYCPDYKILVWNEDSFDLNQFRNCREAYNTGYYAFASDSIRLYALYKYGGIYLDTDMELTQSIDDLLNNDAFSGFETDYYVSCGIIGAAKGNLHIKNLLDSFANQPFIVDGKVNKITIPFRLTNYLSKLGLKHDGKTQMIDKFMIYSEDYFYPVTPFGKRNFTNKTRAIHHWNASWNSKEERRQVKLERFKQKHKILVRSWRLIKKVFKKNKNSN